jgi:hypothetical protein
MPGARACPHLHGVVVVVEVADLVLGLGAEVVGRVGRERPEAHAVAAAAVHRLARRAEPVEHDGVAAVGLLQDHQVVARRVGRPRGAHGRVGARVEQRLLVDDVDAHDAAVVLGQDALRARPRTHTHVHASAAHCV